MKRQQQQQDSVVASLSGCCSICFLWLLLLGFQIRQVSFTVPWIETEPPERNDYSSYQYTTAVGTIINETQQAPYGNENNTDVHIARTLSYSVFWGTLTISSSPNEDLHQTHVPTTMTKNNKNGPSSLLSASIAPYAADHESGRIFFYLMGHNHTSNNETHHIRCLANGTCPIQAALTISQASLNPEFFSYAGCLVASSANDRSSKETQQQVAVVDAEDPRCGKLTFTGHLHPCGGDTAAPTGNSHCEAIGRRALFTKHPLMKYWPASHHFSVYEMDLKSIWMIADYGGGKYIPVDDYYHGDGASATTSPKAVSTAPRSAMSITHDEDQQKRSLRSSKDEHQKMLQQYYPDWHDPVARARWVVRHGLWCTVSTTHEVAFGNIRSVTLFDDTGRPVFFVFDVDPTAQDIARDPTIVLSFSEASLAERVMEGRPCGPQGAGWPTCAQVLLYGRAVAMDPDDKHYAAALHAFGQTHPLAPWLAQGGSHMPGKYYTIDLKRVVVQDYFGGPVEVSSEDYMRYSEPIE